MTTITQIILRLWTWIISIFGCDAKNSTVPEAAAFYRVTIAGFSVAGRLFRCDNALHRDESGAYHRAILQRVGYPALAPRMLEDVAEYIARDCFHAPLTHCRGFIFPFDLSR